MRPLLLPLFLLLCVLSVTFQACAERVATSNRHEHRQPIGILTESGPRLTVDPVRVAGYFLTHFAATDVANVQLTAEGEGASARYDLYAEGKTATDGNTPGADLIMRISIVVADGKIYFPASGELTGESCAAVNCSQLAFRPVTGGCNCAEPADVSAGRAYGNHFIFTKEADR